MKNKEAIKILQVAKAEIEWSAPLDYQKALDMAIEALEKQIPKKFIRDEDEEPICPVCGEVVWNTEYCDSCGQKLDIEFERGNQE